MLITALSGNLHDLPAAERERIDVDPVVFDNESRVKRVQRVRSASGREIGLRLESLRELVDGDILYRDGDAAVVARIAPEDVIVIAPRTVRQALQVAHALGNRHLQAQFFDADSEYGAEVMVVRDDHTVVDHLEHAAVPYTRGRHVMPEAFRHAEHTH